MAVEEITAESYRDVVSQPGITFVSFWATWCKPCEKFGPVYRAASERHPEVRFTKIDSTAHKSMLKVVDVRQIPTIMVYRDGILIHKEAGTPPAEVLDEIVRQTAALDMEQLRTRRTPGDEVVEAEDKSTDH
ncbi:thiol reductase thioredoxin [bacterium]|nr:thiol reductase thioredoxin [bacterium]